MKPITIVGGGIGGLTLGIALRQLDLPVTVWEAGHYPRHRVCGEFISGSGLDVLGRLGLARALEARGAVPARTALFCAGEVASRSRLLPQPALCVSRHVLDACLAERFREAGGVLFEGRRWTSPTDGEGMVIASGRGAQRDLRGWRWFGLKAHARGIELGADLEMHFLRNGYVGICRLGDGVVNLCGLFRTRTAEPGLAGAWKAWLSGPEGSTLNQRTRSAVWQEETFSAVAGLRPYGEGRSTALALGDAYGLIPPLTGNGMSMALESAELAIPGLTAYSREELGWTEARERVRGEFRRRFESRLAAARWVQRVLLWRGGAGVLVRWLDWSPGTWRWLFARTR